MHKDYEVTQTDADIFDRLLTEACTDKLLKERRDVGFWERMVKDAEDDERRQYAEDRLGQAAERLALGFHREATHITSTLVACGESGCSKHRALLVGVA